MLIPSWGGTVPVLERALTEKKSNITIKEFNQSITIIDIAKKSWLSYQLVQQSRTC